MRRPSDITKYEHESYVREAKRERNRYLSHSRRKARYYGHVHNAVYFGTRLSIFGVLPSFLLTMASIWWPGTPIEVWYSARAWMTVTAVFAIPFLYYLFWMTRFSRNRELNWDEDVIQNFIDEYLQAEIDAYEPKDAT